MIRTELANAVAQSARAEGLLAIASDTVHRMEELVCFRQRELPEHLAAAAEFDAATLRAAAKRRHCADHAAELVALADALDQLREATALRADAYRQHVRAESVLRDAQEFYRNATPLGHLVSVS